MRKVTPSILVVATAASMMAAAAYAAPMDAHGEAAAASQQGQQNENVRGVLLDARISGMKAALKLTPAQEKNWQPFEAAVRDGAKLRMQFMAKLREDRGAHATPIARLDDMSNALTQGATQAKKVADAAKPLYDSLNETQKRDFGPLLTTLRPHRQHWAMMERHMRMREGAEHDAK